MLLMNCRPLAQCIHIITSTGLITPMSIPTIMIAGNRNLQARLMIINPRVLNSRVSAGSGQIDEVNALIYRRRHGRVSIDPIYFPISSYL